MDSIAHKKIAIVYDWMDKWGGVERVLITLKEMFPTATFYTSYFDAETAPWAKEWHVETSFIQQLPDFIKKSRVFSLPLYAYAFESFDLSDYDIVISVTSSFAKAVITKPGTLHICYLLTPTRFLWVYPELYTQGMFSSLKNTFAQKYREWDYIAAQRPDKIVTISQITAKRCEKFYRREANVIYPPFDDHYWQTIKSNNETRSFSTDSQLRFLSDKKYFLVVSRLETYKKVDLVVDVFNKKPQEQLVIVGKGTQKADLMDHSQSNITFLEDLTDEQLGLLYAHAEALIMPQEEDFGYVSLEAQFFLCPVIAYQHGGASETVIDGETGLLFPAQNAQSLAEALERFRLISYNVKHSRFSINTFKDLFVNYISTNL